MLQAPASSSPLNRCTIRRRFHTEAVDKESNGSRLKYCQAPKLECHFVAVIDRDKVIGINEIMI